MKAYTLNRKFIPEWGLSTEASNLQGYASYFNDTDYGVIGYNTNYKENLSLLIAGLTALAAFITIASPLLINAHYHSLYMLAREQHTNAIFIIWGSIIMCFVSTISILFVDVYYLLVAQLIKPNIPSRWIYYLTIALATLFVLFDLLLAILVKKKKDFPLPYIMTIFSCQTCCYNTVIAQTLAIWTAIVFMQLASFHLTFIFLAFVASPVQTGSTFLLFLTGILSGISLTTLFLAAFQKRVSPVMTTSQKKGILRSYALKFLHLVMFICILAFTIFFATCFIRITIHVGDVQSGGIPSLIATLAPSALLAGMGYLGKTVLERYVPRDITVKEEKPSREMDQLDIDSVEKASVALTASDVVDGQPAAVDEEFNSDLSQKHSSNYISADDLV